MKNINNMITNELKNTKEKNEKLIKDFKTYKNKIKLGMSVDSNLR